MRLLILLFLFGISCSKPVYDALESEADEILADAEYVVSSKASSVLSAEGGEPETEVMKKCKEAIQAVVEKMEDAIANGKKKQKSFLNDFIALRQGIINNKEQLGKENVQELLEILREHVKDVFIKIVTGLGKKEEQKRAEPEVMKKYKEAIEAFVEKCEDAIANGKKIKKSCLNEFIAMRQEIIDTKEHLGEQNFKELFEILRKHMNDLTIKLVTSLGKEEEQKQSADANIHRELNDAMENVLEDIKKEIDKGKPVKVELLDKLRNLRLKFKELKIDLSERAKELLKKIKDCAKDFLKTLLEKLKLKFFLSDAELLEDLKQNPRLQKALEKLEDWLIAHIPDVYKNVAEEAEAFLRS